MKSPRSTWLPIAALVSLVLSPLAATAAGPPAAAKKPVEDRYWGVSVSEDYRWLENWNDHDVRDWVDGQNTFTRAMLDHLPSRPDVLKRVEALSRSITPRYSDLVSRGGALFALKDQPPKNQPMLVRLSSPEDLGGERVLVDPNTLDPSGSTTIDFFVPSLDGSKVAVSLSKGGTESGDIHVVDARTGKEAGEVIPRVNGGTAGGSVAWNADASGLWYTRYPGPGERPEADRDFYQQVWFHRFGTPLTADRYVIGKDFPKIAEIELFSTDDGKYLLIEVKNGDGGEVAYWLRGPSGAITQVADFKDRITQAKLGAQSLYLLSRHASANGAVLRVPLDLPTLVKAHVIIPASDTAIQSIQIAGTRLYSVDIVGGPNQVRMFTLDGAPLGRLPLPPVSSVNGIVRLRGDEVLVQEETFTEPARWMRYAPESNGPASHAESLEPTALEMKSPADFSDVEVRREFATSKDGTKVPINILMKKGTVLDGHAPLLLYGYGGYGISQQPGFRATRKLWLEQGGIYAVANIRGGGEYGDAWHLAGNLTKKQNVFDDFAACADYLVDHHYTSKDKMACQGGSNGGLLMGAMIAQHPDLFGVVISSVGVYDMLRVELSPNGLFNVTEYGTVKDEAQFRSLLAYSPYQNLKNGTQYPSILLLTGANDPRVAPYNSFKFAARLQATGTTRPVLLRTSMNTGHIGTPLRARNQESADIYSFLFSQLGVTYHPVTPPPAP
ncbi:MAG TPA: prolyl oligopeptidase family serine peptidase [Candidatus Udaeobacter sp.]|jgi:prolyl oligopeptidase|nr:prolyl oligopeptidase family serine peptidase [Candidatus Udaeobacter sp.]